MCCSSLNGGKGVFLEKESCYVDQAGLELTVAQACRRFMATLLPRPPKGWHSSCVLPCLADRLSIIIYSFVQNMHAHRGTRFPDAA